MLDAAPPSSFRTAPSMTCAAAPMPSVAREVADLVGIHLLPVRLADLVHQPQLQRDDRQVGQPVGQDLRARR